MSEHTWKYLRGFSIERCTCGALRTADPRYLESGTIWLYIDPTQQAHPSDEQYRWVEMTPDHTPVKGPR